MKTTPGLFGVSKEIYAWYEFLSPNNTSTSHMISMDSRDITINPGDDIYCDVIYNTDQSATFFVSNHTNGTSSCHTIPNMSACYDGREGEWIDERPTVGYDSKGNAIYDKLTDFGTIKWNKCNVYRRNSPVPRSPLGIVSGLQAYTIHMQNSYNNDIVHFSLAGDHAFWDSWWYAS